MVNPGSTSTRTALYSGPVCLFNIKGAHRMSCLSACRTLADRVAHRMRSVTAVLKQQGIRLCDLDAIAVRGGMLRPCASGVYRINAAMLADLKSSRFGEHASSLGALMAEQISEKAGIPAFVVDPPVVDELCPEARWSGMPGVQRRAVWHALNQKMAARVAARRLDTPYEKLNLIVAHLGGGSSIAAHRRGRVIDVTNALDGEGPFAVERSGGIAAADMVRLAGTESADRLLKCIAGCGGLAGYLGTNDFVIAEKRSGRGDALARQVISAMAYQTAKEIAACAAVLCGEVDAIVLTGAVAGSRAFVRKIKRRVRFIAPVHIVPGEREMQALAAGVLAVLTGRAKVREYPSVPEAGDKGLSARTQRKSVWKKKQTAEAVTINRRKK